MARRQSKDPTEYARTPAWPVRRFLESRAGWIWLSHAAHCGWIDRCAGDGAIADAVVAAGGPAPLLECDIEPRRTRVFRGDGLSESPWSGATGPAILENTPFSLSERFVRSGLKIGWLIVTLQRVNWTAGRGVLFREVGYPAKLVLPNRISFLGNGESDRQEYAWFVFGLPQMAGTYEVLPETPLAERKADYWAPRRKRKGARSALAVPGVTR